ncbi:class E vacuolar protein-sorting machinery protein hse1-like [Lotus japonicus]|uniref:class E vacuolar protein-sorting machinery protein hse1-like n=1 Tax=Lotus japonicus TaxID=34305 RepID=UPI00258AE282|nr:class E vacuolar protein-sorting machinery protein hse1-like [Lotus japonicus]XP_057425965.1 class E vacuolar protein-sorting machinery protein hse1-like [Lotus japonicus]XP_057425968.1 class E vacuolar protein-sorting machinery protein hse1-like [Lotus japonicus]
MSPYPPQNQSHNPGGNFQISQHQMSPYPPQNQPHHPGGNFQNSQYQMSSYPPQNQPPHTGGNVHNSQYQMFSYTSQNQPLHLDENFTNPQYPMHPPQYQFQSQAPPTGSTGSKVSDTQCEATPDDTQHEGLDDIDLEDEDQSSGKKRTRWRVKDDLLLVQSWLNISKDPTVGTDQTALKF